MKKLAVFVLSIMLCLSLAACGSDNQNNNNDVNIPNPVKESSEQEILENTGIVFTLPEDAEDIAYFIIDRGEEASPVAQATFSWQGLQVQYRICAASEYSDISGLYYDWANVLDWKVGGICDGSVCYNAEGAGYCGWYDAAPGLLYNVSVTEKATSALLTDLADAVYVPVQGESDGESDSQEKLEPQG